MSCHSNVIISLCYSGGVRYAEVSICHICMIKTLAAANSVLTKNLILTVCLNV